MGVHTKLLFNGMSNETMQQWIDELHKDEALILKHLKGMHPIDAFLSIHAWGIAGMLTGWTALAAYHAWEHHLRECITMAVLISLGLVIATRAFGLQKQKRILEGLLALFLTARARLITALLERTNAEHVDGTGTQVLEESAATLDIPAS